MIMDKAPREHNNPESRGSKGLVIVHTGMGKGKSTAAFGTALRTLGHGGTVAILQFIKGQWKTGEETAFQAFGERLSWLSLGEGFTWDTKNYAHDVQAAEKAWDISKTYIRDTTHDLVVLDEINYCFQYNFLNIAVVLGALRAKPASKHIILTGGGAPPELIEFADLVSEVNCLKHPYNKGILAQKGIEF